MRSRVHVEYCCLSVCLSVCLHACVACTSYIDLIFIVDVSGSIQSERVQRVREFLVSIVGDLDIGRDSTRVGVAYFSDDAFTAFTLDQYFNRQDVQEAIRYIPYLGGKTNIAAGLRITRTHLLQVTLTAFVFSLCLSVCLCVCVCACMCVSVV